jgi:uncharacterized membrane protein
VFSVATFRYLSILFVPVIWGVVPRGLRAWPAHLAPLLFCAAPTIALNILASSSTGIDLKNPFSQYSLMVVPFLALTLVYAVAQKQAWLTRPGAIAMSSIGLVVLGATARLAMTDHHHATNFAAHQATREAIGRIDQDATVCTTHEIAPHVSHRAVVQFIGVDHPPGPIHSFDYMLLNLADDSATNAGSLTTSILSRVKSDPAFTLQFERDSVYLFKRRAMETTRSN